MTGALERVNRLRKAQWSTVSIGLLPEQFIVWDPKAAGKVLDLVALVVLEHNRNHIRKKKCNFARCAAALAVLERLEGESATAASREAVS